MSDQAIKFGSFSFRITPTRIILIIFGILGVATMLYRLFFGLGATTNLNDGWPFGLWIGIDVMLGVALAAGGFTMCAIIYVFNLKEFKPLAKPAVLTAWLGYLLVVVGLGMDVGLWYNWYQPILNLGYTSVLFEVFVCVLAYNMVLLVEFLPVISERLNWKKIYQVSTRVAVPAVISGIVLSSLHQSSLGALFLIMPHKLNPLWYTDLLPWLFLLSALAVGPAMVTLESALASRAYKMEFEKHILGKLAKAIAIIAALFVALKLWDLSTRGFFGAMFAGTLAGNLFILEIALFAVPILLVAAGFGHKTKPGIILTAGSVIVGVIVNRLNVLFTGLYQSVSMNYTPAVTEFLLSFGLISIGCLAYLFFVENFNVFPIEMENNPYVENQRSQINTKAGMSFGYK